MLNVSSFNTNGLRSRSKFDQVMQLCTSDIICLQETNWDDEIIENFKRSWKGEIYANNGSKRSCGVAILVKEGSVRNIKPIHCDINGRIMILEFEFMKMVFRLINIYAPNVEIDRRDFFKKLKPLCTGNCIVTGDYNVWCDRLDASSCARFRHDSSRKVLLESIAENKLIDLWRAENPNKKEFSRRQIVLGEMRQSRIDLCLVKENIMQYSRNAKYQFTTVSDHAVFSFSLYVGTRGRGGGIWCLNTSLLKEETYKELIINCVKEKMSEQAVERNVGLWWESVKDKIKQISIKYSKRRHFMRKRKEEELKEKIAKELEMVESDPRHNLEVLLKLQNELHEYEKTECQGAIIRSKAQYAIEGEKCTSFFLSMEKQKQKGNYIEELENAKGELVNDLVGVLETAESFYRNLFKKDVLENECVRKVTEMVKVKISENEKKACDEDITNVEIRDAIANSQLNKSPGSDGLPNEFYKTFVDILAPILLRVYKFMEKEQVVPESMSMGVVTILYKKRGSKLKLENYRPLSLLNTDYKIIAKVLASRMKKVIGGIIASTQTYSVPGRDITDTICTIRDVAHYMQKNKGGILLSLDLNKAFDRVDHHFLFKTMERFGFGERMVSWIELLYRNAKSCVKCNGVLTNTFPLERSVRQGCPLSAILYTISMEPLAALIKGDTRIRGIDIPGGGLSVIHQYADDTTITVRDNRSVKMVMEHLDIYGKAAGAKINVDKSEIMYMGNTNERVCEIPFKVAEGSVKILGIDIGKNEKDARDMTWTGVINKLKQTLNFWKQRGLRLRGKVIVVNALIMSKLVYIIGALDMPEWVHNEVNRAVSDFIWGGKGVKIAHSTLTAKYKEGGLQLVDLKLKVKAIRLKVIVKYLRDCVNYGWKYFFKDHVNCIGRCGEHSLMMGFKKSMYEHVPYFYQEVFEAWTRFLPQVKYECTTMAMILNQPVFLNPMARSNGNYLYNRTFMDAGLNQVKDYVYEVIPGFLPLTAIIDEVCAYDEDVKKRTIENMYEKIKSSIPREWVNRINSEEIVEREEISIPQLSVEKSGEMVGLERLKVQDFYQIMMRTEVKVPTSEKVWTNVFPQMDVKKIWVNLNVKYNDIECEDNDFKMRHNRIFTNVVLHQINRLVKRECDVCGVSPESFMHLFLDCGELTDFYSKLKIFLLKNWKQELIESVKWRELMLFGVSKNYRKVHINLLNLVLSHARYAIRIRRNIAHFEGKKVNVWPIFESAMKRNILFVFKHKREEFKRYFIESNTVITISTDGKIMINF